MKTKINRLKGQRVYLCGSIDRISADRANGWRDEVTTWLQERGVIVFNPMKKPINIGLEDGNARNEVQHLKETGQFHLIRERYGIIRNVDLRMCDISDFIVACVDSDVHLMGTVEEITTCNRQKKPVIVFCPQGKKFIANWLFYMLPDQHLFGCLEDALSYLDIVDNHLEVDHLKRWFFFDQEKLTGIC